MSRPSNRIDAAVGFQQPANQRKQCRLAGAVGTNDAERFSVRDRKRNGVDDDKAAEPLRDIDQLQYHQLSQIRQRHGLRLRGLDAATASIAAAKATQTIASILPPSGDFLGGLIVDNDDGVFSVAAEPPLTADERRLGDIVAGERRQSVRAET